MHATKLFNSFEGGIVTTNDDELAQKLAPIRNFGITGQDSVSGWGSNFKLSEVHAAFANRQLDHIDSIIKIYQSNARTYTKLIEESAIDGLRIWNKDFLALEGCTHSYVCLEVSESFPLSRDQIITFLRDNDVYAKRYFYPGVHKCQPYADRPSETNLSVTLKLCGSVLVLPTGSMVGEADIHRIVQLLDTCSKSSASLQQQLRETRINVDISYLDERIQYLQELKSKHELEVKKVNEDLEYLRISASRHAKRHCNRVKI